ncbi:MAG: ABC transporter permease [Candidatus Thermoplasmatota archaeon]|jgi:putative ABC transport system permease protein|nr:ABC transporter permease [Candidatus Thermoplasmatota archaeon]
MAGLRQEISDFGAELRKVPLIGWMVEHLGDIILVGLLLYLLMMVLLALYVVPAELKGLIVASSLIFLGLVLAFLGMMALFNKLMFRMGLRNLIRHRTDSLIAILGFMIGTSIICSSLAIGDTMTNMIEGIVYEGFDLYDEYITVEDPDGNPQYFNGSAPNDLASIVWSLNDDEELIDGVTWEVWESGSVIDTISGLFEPSMSLRAVSPYSFDKFGTYTSKGEKLTFDLGLDEVYIVDDAAEKLNAEPGHKVMVSSRGGTLEFTVKGIIDGKGRGATFSTDTIYFSYEGIWALLGHRSDGETPNGQAGNWSGGNYNVLLISNKGGKVAGGELCSEVKEKLEKALIGYPHPSGPGAVWRITNDKGSNVEQAKTSMESFTKLFLVLGTFTIIAGITLIINIFVMLSEERKEEMGISRAIGMRRKHLRRVYLFEGTFYSIISSVIGVMFGVLAGYLIILGMQRIFEQMGVTGFSILDNYTVTPVSLLLSFIAGFTITIATTLMITQRVAVLNIVTAIRNTPEPVKESGLVRRLLRLTGTLDPRTNTGDGSRTARMVSSIFSRSTIAGAILIVIGTLLALSGLPGKIAWSTYLGISLVLVGLSLLLKNLLGDRIAFNITAVLLLVFWIAPIPFFMDFKGDMEMFVLSGVFMVSSGVLLLVWNTDIILWGLERVLSLVKVSPASIKMAISYPIKKRFRTGTTIFMFALIIFTITGMSMIVEIFNVNTESFEKTIGGGYDIVGISGISGIDDLDATVMMLDPVNHSKVDWERTSSLGYGYLRINYTVPMLGTKDELIYPCAGVSDDFVNNNSYGFSEVAWDLIDDGGRLEHSDSLVWNALKGSSFVVLDGNLAGGMFGPPAPFSTKVGKKMTLVNYRNEHINRTVIAFTRQMGVSGVFMHQDEANASFSVMERKVHLIVVNEDIDPSDVSDGLRRVLLPYGFFTFIVHDLVEEILKANNAFFDLFNAFLSLGLVIGIVGLGIVTLRSVYERRHEIGMMRAVGFTRGMVVGSFLGESGFIAGSGLIIGSLLGVILGWMLWRDGGFGSDFDKFGIPYLKILLIVMIAFLFALSSSIPPSLKAARVTPAEALRYE